MRQPPLSLYIHFPWCIKKCPYCDFNSHTLKQTLPEKDYLDQLIAELKHKSQYLSQQRPFISIFMGGGTPSLFSPDAMAHLLTQIKRIVPQAPDCEVTMEANPGSILDQQQLQGYRNAGINRLSIGVQSFQETYLKKLGRIHSPTQAMDTVINAHKAGFTRINIDLMYGLPQQTVEHALTDLHIANTLPIDHLSWYELTIEPNTLFHHQRPPLPTDDAMWDMHCQGLQLIQANGFKPYEISAYSRDQPCRHNLNYWQYGDYLGIGAGAHSKLTQPSSQKIQRYVNTKHPALYINADVSKCYQTTAVNVDEQLFEFFLNALRLTDGFCAELPLKHTYATHQQLSSLLERAVDSGLLGIANQHISPTALGARFLNDLTEIFLPQA